MKTLQIENYPTRATAEAKAVADDTAEAARQLRNRLEIMHDDNERHADELERAIVDLKTAPAGATLITHDEALEDGGGRGYPLIYGAKRGQRDPYLAPWGDEEIDAAVKAAEDAEAAAVKARTRWIKLVEANQTRDVLTECRQAETNFYWRVDRSGIYRGDPIPMTEVVTWPRVKLEGLLTQNVIGEIPPSLYMADSPSSKKAS